MSTTTITGRQQPTSEFVMIDPTTGASLSISTLAGTYNRAAAVGATPGNAVLVNNVTTAGTVTLTLTAGSVTLSVPLGSTVLPFGATAAVLGTAVGGTFQSLFYA